MGYTQDDWLAINTIRTLAVSSCPYSVASAAFICLLVRYNHTDISICQIDAVSKANSGHPGAPMGLAPVAHVLFNKFMTFNPKNPLWLNRDRFVLSYVYNRCIEMN
jgi:hypothetical protein